MNILCAFTCGSYQVGAKNCQKNPRPSSHDEYYICQGMAGYTTLFLLLVSRAVICRYEAPQGIP